MKEVQPPERPKSVMPYVFLAGGITGAEDWQDAIVKKLEAKGTKVVVLNPRRDDFDISDPNMEEQQIQWEAENLERADLVAFWFPKDALCPIALLELGKFLSRPSRDIVIGVEDGFWRERDVYFQAMFSMHRNLHRKIVHSLDHLADKIDLWAK